VGTVYVPDPSSAVSYRSSLQQYREMLLAIGEDPALYGEHGDRSGGLSTAPNSGQCSWDQMRQHGRWSSDSAPKMYFKPSLKYRKVTSLSLKF